MNALINALPAYFNPSNIQQNEDIKKRAVDPSSNANEGFGNNPTQKTSFPAGSVKSTAASTKSTAAASSSSVQSSTASSSSAPTSSSSPTPSSSASVPVSSVSVTSSSTSTSPTISPSSSADNSSSGLSGGAIGAIVAVIVIIIGGISAFFIMRRRRQKRIAARAGAGAMRDPYNEGFSTFPPPPAPMAFTSDTYHSTPAATSNNNGAAGSAHYQPQVQQQQLPPLASPTATYQTTNPASYPITAPNMISTPPTPSSNTPATTSIDPLSANLANDTQPGDIWQQPPIGTYTVLTTYTPTLSDEIDVQPNDQVQIYEQYDDGWCLGINITRGQTRGVFPKHCVTPEQTNEAQQLANPSSQSLAVSDPVTITTANKRVSSLYMENPNSVLQ